MSVWTAKTPEQCSRERAAEVFFNAQDAAFFDASFGTFDTAPGQIMRVTLTEGEFAGHWLLVRDLTGLLNADEIVDEASLIVTYENAIRQ